MVLCYSKQDEVSVRSCAQIKIPPNNREKLPTQQIIYPLGPSGSLKCVQCDFESDGGGWTIIQRRSSGPREEFSQAWAEYENGFGSCSGNYWIGLSTIYALTSQGAHELRIELTDWEGNTKFARYSNFSVSGPSDFYRLTVEGYSGNAGDSLTQYHNGRRFSTRDKDNDEHEQNCGLNWKSGWWFSTCFNANLNGLYIDMRSETLSEVIGITWYGTWKTKYSMKSVEMKIR